METANVRHAQPYIIQAAPKNEMAATKVLEQNTLMSNSIQAALGILMG